MDENRYSPILILALTCIITLAAVLHYGVAIAEKRNPGMDVDYAGYCRNLYVPIKLPRAVTPKSYLGIYIGQKKIAEISPSYPDGVYVSVAGIVKGSPAQEVGLKKDDVILAVNGILTSRSTGSVEEAFRNAIDKLSIGSELRLDVLRGHCVKFLKTKTAQRPQHDQPQADHPDLPNCTTSESLLYSSLSIQGTLPSFQNILGGLYRQSNQMHNIGSTHEMPYHPLQLKDTTYLLRNPLTAGVITEETSYQLSEPLQDQVQDIGALLHKAAQLTGIEYPACQNQWKEYTFPALVQTLEGAAADVRRAISSLTNEEQKLLREKALDPWEDPQWNAILELSMKVNREAIFTSLSCLASFLTADHLAMLKEDLLKRFEDKSRAILYQANTSAGPVIVGSNMPKVYDKDAALILDLGSNNLYLNNAGGTRPEIPVAMVINWGGNNRYVARENFSQGAALIGGGFLIDLGGHSTFVGLDGSQGVGFWGAGLLYFRGGNAVFQARKTSQGVGQMGVGMLLGRDGDNSYSCLYEGQALGLFGGAGILINEGGHNIYRLGGLQPDDRDPLKSTVSMGQGFGRGLMPEDEKMAVPGGIGLLIDEKGEDTYIADYFAQGSSYYYSIGMLDNRGDNNRFIAGRYAQGAGIHTSIGVLLNRGGGSSFYSSLGFSQGMGHDYGVGLLQSDRGLNDYHGGILVQGAATRGGIGMLIDPDGQSRFNKSSENQDSLDKTDCMGIVVQPDMEEEKPGHSGKVVIYMKDMQRSMVK